MSDSLVRVAHSVEGRIRLKLKRGKGDPELLEAFAARFRGLPGIERVKTNPVTGTVVLIYDPDRHSEFVGHVARSGGLDRPLPPKTDLDKMADAVESEAEYLAEHSKSARAFVDFFKKVDQEIKSASGNNVDLKMTLAAGVVAATFIEIGATAATPVWVTLLLFGANNYLELREKAREAESAAKGNGAVGFGKVRVPRRAKKEAGGASAGERERAEQASAGAGI